jgi:tRNA-splicing ligase RtcB
MFPVTLGKTEHPVLMWASHDDVDQSALDQLRAVGNLPWVHGVRVMPDVHYGRGATVGSVIAMRGAVSPAAVGVDIGCGMAAVRLNLMVEDLPDDLHPLRSAIEAAVPVGFRQHASVSPLVGSAHSELGRRFAMMAASFDELRAPQIADRRSKALAQCGTLGGGNHFIELCADTDGVLWVTLHSGSRNIGKELADRHIHAARNLEHNSFLPRTERDMAVFLAGTEEMDAYLADLWWAQDYALLNRHVMLATVQRIVATHLGPERVRFDPPIQCHHNYVAEETHDGVDVIVTRKGAIRAEAGDMGIIPGSMGTGSYIVEGLGNDLSFRSASHGAGRRMSRAKARQTYTADDLAEQTSGIECRKDAGVVDEIPGAYKDIDAVMAAQSDLVRVRARLRTLLCVKG